MPTRLADSGVFIAVCNILVPRTIIVVSNRSIAPITSLNFLNFNILVSPQTLYFKSYIIRYIKSIIFQSNSSCFLEVYPVYRLLTVIQKKLITLLKAF